MLQLLRVMQFYSCLAGTYAKGMFTADLAERLDTTDRSIRRWIPDLNELARSGLPDVPFSLPQVRLTTREGRSYVELVPTSVGANLYQAAAAYYALAHLTSMDDDVLGLSASDVLDKVVPEDEGERRELLERVRRGFHYRPFMPKLYHESQWLDVIVRCIAKRHPVTLSYLASGADEPVEHRVDPLTLVLFREAFYLLARQDWGGKTLFAIERIQRIDEDRDQTFEFPVDFDPHNYFEGVFGIYKTRKKKQRVRIAFPPEVARAAAERNWPGLVGWIDAEDGRRVLELDLPPSVELEGHLLSWGPAAEVLEPEPLRKAMAQKTKAMAALYA